MLIITISSAIASWLRLVPGGFWLVVNSFGWFAVLVVTIATQLIAFCLTVLFVLVRLVPALIEQFLWLLCGYILPVSFGVTFSREFLPWWWVSALSQVTGLNSIDLDVFRSYWANLNFFLVFPMVFLYWLFEFLAEALFMFTFFILISKR